MEEVHATKFMAFQTKYMYIVGTFVNFYVSKRDGNLVTLNHANDARVLCVVDGK